MRHLIVLICLWVLSACTAIAIEPYKLDIQQGNVVTQEMISQLKPGMTKSQVRFVMGTPLLMDAFHKDRWDYIYRYEKSGKLVEHRKLAVLFEEDRLKKITGDVTPTNK